MTSPGGHSPDRRTFLLAAACTTVAGPGAAGQDRPPPAEDFDAALKRIIGEAKPVQGKLTIEVPEIAENGNTVPYTLSLDSPMTEQDHVKAMHILATANPRPEIASFELTPASGRAKVASRMRLARSQDVVAVAELSDGRFVIARRPVKVTIGGCGG